MNLGLLLRPSLRLVVLLVLLVPAATPAHADTLGTFESTCTTPKVVFALNETMCVKAMQIDAGFENIVRFTWRMPNGTIINGNTIAASGQTQLFTFSAPNNVNGNWQAQIRRTTGTFRTGVFITLPTGMFRTIPVCRIIDTRTEGNPLNANTTSPRGVQTCSAVLSATSTLNALAVNVTAVDATANGDLNLWSHQLLDPPNTTLLSFTAGRARANNAVVSVTDGSAFDVRATMPSGTCNYIIDVVGYFE